MTDGKPRIRVKAGAVAFPAAPARQKPTMRYLRGDRSGVLNMRRAITRDAKIDVREAAERASALALDFMHNSGWISGAADQIVADTVGTELKLNARPELSALGYSDKERADWCRFVESEWRRYAWNPAECDLAGKMTVPEMVDAVVRTYLAYGEAFGVLDFITVRARRSLGLTTGTKVSLVAPHRLPRTSREFEGLDQGIFHDALGRALVYRFRSRDGGIEVDRDIKAGDVIHVMDRGLNPGSPRGISVMAPALKVIAQSDQLADATLATALMQTIFAATIKSPEPSEQAFQAIQTLADSDPPPGFEGDWSSHVGGIAEDLIDIWGMRIEALKEKGVSMSDPARINHLGPGEEFEMHTAATPGSQYIPFSQNLQREMARCLGVTFESLSMDHSSSTYSSVRMAVSTMWPITTRRRERIAAPFAQALYEAWLEESIAEGRIPLKGGYQAFLANKQKVVWAEWRGPEKPSADPYKDSLANKVDLETGAATLQRIYAAKGLDWEEELEQAGKEKAKLDAMGIPAPHGRSQGGSGAGPLGGAADGRRDPIREGEDA
ncbi:lambda family phage portal protein [Pseudorhizobium tarimense]|uniref:Lambda family phage portal protein n=1 Tax=Pseudorhizobium tarimense TaxID=1079109 RepID=A0ABV2H2A8_9HYPH|nr:phage portal protein [Pseudorhizobium tarimense]MCJ8517815.1 phage portal protein [Pseudorhizobium tarimense]